MTLRAKLERMRDDWLAMSYHWPVESDKRINALIDVVMAADDIPERNRSLLMDDALARLDQALE